MLGCNFEVVSKYADAGLELPMRKTEYSAGYDLVAAEDIIIPSAMLMMEDLLKIFPVEIANDEFISFENMKDSAFFAADGKAENIIATVATEFLVFVFRDYVF